VTPIFRGVIDWTGQVMTNCTTGKSSEATDGKKEIVKAVQISAMKLPFNRHLIRAAGISGAMAVALGAYGSHGKKI